MAPILEKLGQTRTWTVRVFPLHSRQFAEAVGKPAKNGTVNPAVPARFGLPKAREATPPQPWDFQELSNVRTMRSRLLNRLDGLTKLSADGSSLDGSDSLRWS